MNRGGEGGGVIISLKLLCAGQAIYLASPEAHLLIMYELSLCFFFDFSIFSRSWLFNDRPSLKCLNE